jgi:hypothetical protein
MPVEPYYYQLEPPNQDASIWRFMSLEKFHDLIDSGKLYFCRADLFNDEREGLPPQEFLMRFGLSPLDLHDRQQLTDHIGIGAQSREEFYVSCWHLFDEERLEMWKNYGKDGVAICSRYSLLKSALDAMPDRAFMGLVRYDSSYMIRANVLSYITNKRAKYADEQEVRAFLWILDPNRGGNRHIDAEGRVHPHVTEPPPDSVSKGEKRAVDLDKLITQVVVAPWASTALVSEVEETVKTSGHTIPVIQSVFARYKQFLPDPQAKMSSCEIKWR